MAFITVRSLLQRSDDERRWMKQTADETKRIADALVALVAKLNEPDPEPDQQPAVDALVAKLAESNTTLADEVAKILAANP